jgi:tRNA threonylcarbamoyl adenosine modification protein YeaZ
MPNLSRDRYALALHTTTPQLGIAISNYAQDSRSQVWDLGRDLASHLHQHLQEIIAPQTWQDLEFIAVAKGPGGFTGSRVGVVTARTIAQQLNIPLFGISNLAAIAIAQKQHDDKLVAVQMNASREQLFVAIYQPDKNGGVQTYLADTLMTPEAWQETLDSLKATYQLIKADQNTAKTVTNILDLAYLEWQQDKSTQWSEVVPFYGQHPVTLGQ